MKQRWLFILLIVCCCAIAETYDPMMPAGYRVKEIKHTVTKLKATPPASYVLRQILLSERGNRAVINGYVVKEGSTIAKARVSKIESNKVVLIHSGKQVVLTLNHQIPKVRR